jgi:sec-independent protein translocase protein TatA
MAYENVILVVILVGALLFGSKKLPELARSIGRAQTEYEKARIEAQNEIRGDFTDANRAKFQNAAKRIGVENSEKLSDDELKDAIRKRLDS